MERQEWLESVLVAAETLPEPHATRLTGLAVELAMQVAEGMAGQMVAASPARAVTSDALRRGVVEVLRSGVGRQLMYPTMTSETLQAVIECLAVVLARTESVVLADEDITALNWVFDVAAKVEEDAWPVVRQLEQRVRAGLGLPQVRLELGTVNRLPS